MSKYQIGQNAKLSQSFTIQDVETFAKLTGDINPIHLDPEFAKDSIFGEQIVHGMLVSSMFSTIIANQLPGQGAIYMGQTLNFKAPVFLNDTVTATVTVLSIDEQKKIMKLSTSSINDKNIEVISGEAIIKFC